MKEVIERLKIVMDEYKTNPNKLSGGDGALQRKIARQLKSETITLDIIELILNKCQGLSVEWLVLGVGDMIKPTNNQEINGDVNITVSGNSSHVTTNNAGLNKCILEMIQEKDRQIANMQRQIDEKDKQINNLFALLNNKQ